MAKQSQSVYTLSKQQRDLIMEAFAEIDPMTTGAFELESALLDALSLSDQQKAQHQTQRDQMKKFRVAAAGNQ